MVQRIGISWLLIALVLVLALPAEAADPVATVNGENISWDMLDREVDKIREMSAMQGEHLSDDQVNVLKQEVLEKLIDYELLWQQSAVKNISVPNEAVQQEIAELMSRFADEKAFRETIDGLGMSFDDLELQIRQYLAVRILIETEVTASVSVTPEESQSFYHAHEDYFREPEQIQASHILVEVSDDASKGEQEQAEQNIQAIAERLKQGADFAEVAREESACPSGSRGGDLGYFARGNLDERFEEAAFALGKDETSPVVKTSFGFHIIKVTDRKPARLMPFEEAKENIDRHLKGQKTQESMDAYLDDLRKEAVIERFL